MKRMILTLVFGSLMAAGISADPASQALGFWKSVSDVKGEEGKVTALWSLTVDPQGRLQGTVVWVPGKATDEKYACKKPDFNGKPVRGTFWMTGLKKAGDDRWTGGTIVDIGNSNGDVYGCDVKVVGGGKKLEMRGYLGVAFFGRTQTWESSTPDEAKLLVGS